LGAKKSQENGTGKNGFGLRGKKKR
jgi:hypothetical protein